MNAIYIALLRLLCKVSIFICLLWQFITFSLSRQSVLNRILDFNGHSLSIQYNKYVDGNFPCPFLHNGRVQMYMGTGILSGKSKVRDDFFWANNVKGDECIKQFSRHRAIYICQLKLLICLYLVTMLAILM